MKVFISWSGNQSRLIAEALHDWIPNILNNVEPWMSRLDIRSGKQWMLNLSKALEGTDFGIVCLTPTNLAEPWLMFESGALAKKVDEAYVCAYLTDVAIIDIAEPLRPFQASVADKDGTKKLLDTINQALGEKGRPQPKLDEAFDVWWPRLAEKLTTIKPDAPVHKKKIELDDLAKGIDELLQLMRASSPLEAERLRIYRYRTMLPSWEKLFAPEDPDQLKARAVDLITQLFDDKDLQLNDEQRLNVAKFIVNGLGATESTDYTAQRLFQWLRSPVRKKNPTDLAPDEDKEK